ncbi:hypothetical protein GCM10022403_050870 [Streptomyces coacervatus]|uniref:Uncharacterized protein n=1 Tax=Streptomyces coacervatus TaxID=647381 RepID=A0ABP7I3G6_9ACTN
MLGTALAATVHPDWLLVAAPHSRTTFSILGNTGVALLAVVTCVQVTARMPRLTRLATPSVPSA